MSHLSSAWVRTALGAAPALAAQQAFAAPVVLRSDLAGWACTGVWGSSAADGDITLSPLGNAQYGLLITSGSSALGVSPLATDSNSRGDGTENNRSRVVSGAFHDNAGDQFDLRLNYIATDGKGFDDYAWARLPDASDNSLVAWLFTARGSNSSTGNIVPGDVVDKHDFDPDEVIVDYRDFDFHSKTTADPVNWSQLGSSNGTCWRDNAAGCGYTGWLHSQVSVASAGNYRVELGVVNWGDQAFDSGLAFNFAGLSVAAPPPVPVPEPEPAALQLTLLGLAALAVTMRRGKRRRS